MAIATTDSVVRSLTFILLDHVLICSWIVFLQVRMRLFSPIAGLFLVHVALLLMAERSWRLQVSTMHIWHRVVRRVFRFNRILYGGVVIWSATIWARIFNVELRH